MIRAIRKPIMVEAIQWTGGNWVNVLAFAGSKVNWHTKQPPVLAFSEPASGTHQMPLPVGSWLIKQPGDFLTAYDNETFKALYQEVD